MSLINNDGKSLSHKKIFEELIREIFDEIIELTNDTNLDDVI